MEEKLQLKKNEMEALHKEVYELFLEKNISGALKNEYNNKITQYDSMYTSLEDMKKMMKDDAR